MKKRKEKRRELPSLAAPRRGASANVLELTCDRTFNLIEDVGASTAFPLCQFEPPVASYHHHSPDSPVPLGVNKNAHRAHSISQSPTPMTCPPHQPARHRHYRFSIIYNKPCCPPSITSTSSSLSAANQTCVIRLMLIPPGDASFAVLSIFIFSLRLSV